MSQVLLVLSLLAAMMLSVAGVATAQETATDVDVAAIAETAIAADPAALVTGLETPPDDAELPEGFVNPPSGVSENADLVEQFTGAIGDIDGAIGNVNHAFDTDPEVVPGLLSAGILTYIVTEEEITADALDEFEEGASEGLDPATPAAAATTDGATPPAAGPTTEGSVERVDLGGVEAVVVNVGVELGGVNAVVQIVAVPVGNTMVIGTVLVADQGEVDADAVLAFAEDLTVAGVSHLGTVAEGAQ